MKARNSVSGNLETVYVKALDSMPVGTQVEYTGSTIPVGWEEVNESGTVLLNWTQNGDNQNALLDDLTKYKTIMILCSETNTDTSGNANIIIVPSIAFIDYFYGVGNTASGKSLNIYYQFGGNNVRCYYIKSENKMRIWSNGLSSTYCKIIGYK